MSYELLVLNLVSDRVFEVNRKELSGICCLEAELPWQQRIACSKSILSPKKLKFNMVRDTQQLKKCTKFQLILT